MIESVAVAPAAVNKSGAQTTWVPSYVMLCQAMGLDRKANLAKAAPSGALVLLLLKMALENSPFDTDAYLADNPDVRAAVESGKIANPKEHYVQLGYFEGRLNRASIVVDELWYLKQYPDVATAILSGKIKSATQHYQSSGMAEMRSPNSSIEPTVALWREVMASMSPSAK